MTWTELGAPQVSNETSDLLKLCNIKWWQDSKSRPTSPCRVLPPGEFNDMSPDPLNVSHRQLNSFLVMLLTSKLIKIINRWPKSIPCWLWPSDIETTNSLHTQQALHSRSNSWHVLYRQSTWNASMCFTVNRLPSGLWTSWSVSLCRITSNGPCCSRGTSKLSYQHTSVRTTVSLTHYNTVRSMSVFNSEQS